MDLSEDFDLLKIGLLIAEHLHEIIRYFLQSNSMKSSITMFCKKIKMRGEVRQVAPLNFNKKVCLNSLSNMHSLRLKENYAFMSQKKACLFQNRGCF